MPPRANRPPGYHAAGHVEQVFDVVAVDGNTKAVLELFVERARTSGNVQKWQLRGSEERFCEKPVTFSKFCGDSAQTWRLLAVSLH